MHIVSRRKEPDEVTARVSYSGPYRFRLWLAALEDSRSLDMGFRLYFAHIMRSLESWARLGTKFLQEDGKSLSLDSLTQDDLWGFLGKENEAPRGPKRRLNDLKIAILDVYFKKNYPLLADAFSRSGVPVELATTLKLFFEGGLAKEPFADYIAPWHGLYLARLDVNPAKAIRASREGEVRPYVIRAIMVRPSDRPDSRIVHSVELPLRPEFLKQGSKTEADFKKMQRLLNHHQAAPTTIQSGIALVSLGHLGEDNIKLSCILRDRTTYQPATSDFFISRFTEGLSETRRYVVHAIEFSGGFPGHSYNYCGLEQENAKKRQVDSIFDQQLFDELWRLYDTLGDGV